MIAKLNESNIYDGCLAQLRDKLTSVLPPGQKWMVQGISNLVGNPEPINEHNTPYLQPPVYYQIYFGNNFIKPISYSLMGRRMIESDTNYLRAWEFYGLTRNNDWILLDENSSFVFSFGLVKNFKISKSYLFKGFMIRMTQSDSSGQWALCLGQIDVFGYIYPQTFFSVQKLVDNLFTLLFTSFCVSQS